MRTIAVVICIATLTACTATQSRPTSGPPASRDVGAGPASDRPAAHTRVASESRDCRLKRAIDGHVVCAPRAKTSRHERALTASLPIVPPPAQNDTMHAQPGEYLVIGSFKDRDNATRWAAFNAEFGTEVYAASRDHHRLYRVVVGPLEAADSRTMLREIFSAVGLTGSWHIALCGEARGTGACPDVDHVGMTRVAER